MDFLLEEDNYVKENNFIDFEKKKREEVEEKLNEEIGKLEQEIENVKLIFSDMYMDVILNYKNCVNNCNILDKLETDEISFVNFLCKNCNYYINLCNKLNELKLNSFIE